MNPRKLKEGVFLDRLGFIILSILKNNGATNRLSSMTVREIAGVEELGWRENTIFKKLKGFRASGLVGCGLKEGRANTYYITPKGCECLEEERSMA